MSSAPRLSDAEYDASLPSVFDFLASTTLAAAATVGHHTPAADNASTPSETEDIAETSMPSRHAKTRAKVHQKTTHTKRKHDSESGPESDPESEAWNADNEADGLTPGLRLGSRATRTGSSTQATPRNEPHYNSAAPAATTTTTTSDMDADMDEDDLVEGITSLTPAEAAFLCKLQARTAMLVHDAPYGLAGNDVGGSVFGSLHAQAGTSTVHWPRLRDEAVEDMRTRGA